MQDIFNEIEEKERLLAKEKALFEDEQRAIRATLKSKDGRATLNWVLSLCGLDSSVTSSDALLTASLSGRRDVGLSILARLKSVDFALVAKMQKEDFDGRNYDNHTRDNPDSNS